MLGTEWVVRWAELTAAAAHEHRVELIELDRAIGDGDHGENLDRGFSEVEKQLETLSEPTPAVVLRTIATTLISKVGGASGPLLGTAYLRMSSVAPDELDGKAVAAMIDAACKGVQMRGKATVGEKTMVDTWEPAARAALAAAETGGEPLAVLEAAAKAGSDGAQATLPMVATKGRASYLGERSAGHLDPGAVSSSYILDAAVKAAQ